MQNRFHLVVGRMGRDNQADPQILGLLTKKRISRLSTGFLGYSRTTRRRIPSPNLDVAGEFELTGQPRDELGVRVRFRAASGVIEVRDMEPRVVRRGLAVQAPQQGHAVRAARHGHEQRRGAPTRRRPRCEQFLNDRMPVPRVWIRGGHAPSLHDRDASSRMADRRNPVDYFVPASWLAKVWASLRMGNERVPFIA